MKKLIAALVLAAVTVQAHAYVDICEMKRSIAEAQQCYLYGAKGGILRMKENYKRIINSSQVSEKDKTYIEDNQKKWEKAVDSKCDDNACYFRAVGERNEQMEEFMRNRNVQPM